MNRELPPGRWTLLRALRSHPLAFVLLGMTGTVLLVHPGGRTPSFPLGLALAAALMLGGWFLRRTGSAGERVALVLTGAALILPVLVYGGTSYHSIRSRLRGNTVHLVGTWSPSGTYRVWSVDRRRHEARLFVPGWALPREEGSPPPTTDRRLAVTGTVQWPGEDPGFSDYLRTHGFHGTLDVLHVHAVERRGPGGPGDWLRSRIGDWLNDESRLYPRTASLLGALILGRTDALPTFLRDLLRRLGLSHLFVISGFHVGLLYLLLRRCLAGLPPVPRLGGITAGLGLYLGLLRWPVSATRAGIMIFVVAGCETVGRRKSTVSALLAAVVLMVMVRPPVLFDAGFQLSVAAMAGIALLLPYRSLVGGFPGGLLFLVSLGAYLGVVPVVLVWFHYLTPAGAPLGFLASLIFPVLLGGLFVQGVMMAVDWGFVAAHLEGGLERGIRALDGLVQGHPFLVGAEPVSAPAGFVLAVGIVLMVARPLRWPHRLVGTLLVVLVGVGALAPGFAGRLDMNTVDGIPVTALGTRSGRTVVVLPPGVDPGPRGIDRLGQYLNRRGVFHVDLLVSDYRRRRIYERDPAFTVGSVFVHWRDEGRAKWSGGGFDPRRRALRVPGLEIVYKEPPFVKDNATSSTRVVAGTDRGWCFVVPGSNPGETADPAPRGACKPVNLSEQSFVWSLRRHRRLEPGTPRPGIYYGTRDLIRRYLVAP